MIETKIVQNSIRKEQIEGHIEVLNRESHLDRQRLLVLTPDTTKPKVLNEIPDPRIAWANFDNLVEILTLLCNSGDDWMVSNRALPTEREKEMMRELVRFLTAEKLVGVADQAVIVAARIALSEYQKYSVYICQPNRTFQDCLYLGFYADGSIHRHIPKILDQIENVILQKEEVLSRTDIPELTRIRLLELIEKIQLDSDRYDHHEEAKVIFLSTPDSPETITLPYDIKNNLKSESQRNIAFVQGQRYVSLAKLNKKPKTTQELID